MKCDKIKVNKHCFNCFFYNERTPGTGYCSEWDTIVEMDDVCIEETEKKAFENFKQEKSKK